jgi:predicted  nucleic acid-binding Zn-ribbon protein
MALKASTRGWLAAASQNEVDALRNELDRLAAEVGALRLSREERDAQHAHALGALRDDLDTLAGRFDARAEEALATADQLAHVARRVETGEHALEQVRTNLAGLAEQLRWESEDVRKALVAIIERVERERKTG